MKIIKTFAFVFLTAMVCLMFKFLTVGMVASPSETISKAIAGEKGHDVEYVARNMGNFTAVKVCTFYDVVLEYDPAQSGKVCYRVSNDFKDLVQIDVIKGVLTFSTKKTVGATKFKNWEKKLSKITVYMPQPVTQIWIDGSGDVEVKGNVPFADNVNIGISGSGDIETEAFNTHSLSLQIRGAGDIKLKGETNLRSFNAQIMGSGDIEVNNINTASCVVQVNGSGDTTLSGTAESAIFIINGSGDIKGSNLICDCVEAQNSASGDIEVNAKSSVTAAAFGSGKVIVQGNPESNTTNGNKNNIIFR